MGEEDGALSCGARAPNRGPAAWIFAWRDRRTCGHLQSAHAGDLRRGRVVLADARTSQCSVGPGAWKRPALFFSNLCRVTSTYLAGISLRRCMHGEVQAIAIGLSEAREKGAKVPRKGSRKRSSKKR